MGCRQHSRWVLQAKAKRFLEASGAKHSTWLSLPCHNYSLVFTNWRLAFFWYLNVLHSSEAKTCLFLFSTWFSTSKTVTERWSTFRQFWISKASAEKFMTSSLLISWSLTHFGTYSYRYGCRGFFYPHQDIIWAAEPMGKTLISPCSFQIKIKDDLIWTLSGPSFNLDIW